jgi:UMP-CMP kinase
MAPAIEAPKDSGKLAAPKKETPTFSGADVAVLFVLGGPGAGKGNLLRAEQDRPGSEFGALIKDCIKNGSIVPMEVTVQLLENAMTETLQQTKSDQDPKPKGKFLIDGFPRKMDQALKFEETVCPARFVLFFDCPEEVMQKRLLKRGETSGRADDNLESIKKRFKTFVETSMPVVDHYEKQGRVVRIPATDGPDQVYALTKAKVEERLGKNF